MGRILIPTSIGILILAGGWWYMTQQDGSGSQKMTENGSQMERSKQPPSASGGEDNLIEFACDGGKKITAVFRPESVGLTLSDGRQMELQQLVNGSDISYHNEADTIQFMGRGEGGALIEGGTATYENCVAMI